MRREYEIHPIIVNGLSFKKLIIEPHVDKHSDHISDELIKVLIKYLDQEKHIPTGERGSYKYFASRIKHGERFYKLIWSSEESFLYLGVITAFKDKRMK